MSVELYSFLVFYCGHC